MTVFEKIKLQEAYQKVLNESWGDIINAGYSSMAMGSPFAPRPYKPGTNELKSSEELQREQENSAIAGAVGLGAAAAVANPAAAATAGKYAMNAFNAYSAYELGKEFSDNSPDAANLAVGLAVSNPKKAIDVGTKLLKSRWGWVPGVAYPVINGFVDGFRSGVDSQPSADQPPLSDNQTPPSANQRRTINANQNSQPKVDKKQTTTDDNEAANLDYWNGVVQRANRTGWPISNDGTNNVVDKVGVKWVKNQDYKERFTDLWNVVNGKITRDTEKESNSGK
jgi:hypothetical protein